MIGTTLDKFDDRRQGRSTNDRNNAEVTLQRQSIGYRRFQGNNPGASGTIGKSRSGQFRRDKDDLSNNRNDCTFLL